MDMRLEKNLGKSAEYCMLYNIHTEFFCIVWQNVKLQMKHEMSAHYIASELQKCQVSFFYFFI